MDKAKYGHGIAAWTAAVFIRDNPACTFRQIQEFLHRNLYMGCWRIMFTPSERHKRHTMRSTAYGLFWTRELGHSEYGFNRQVYRFTITPQGEEFAAGPRPPTRQEMNETRRRKMLAASHPGDWVLTAQKGDLLMVRESKRLWYPISASRSHVPVRITSEKGNLVFNSASHYGCERGEMFMFVEPVPYDNSVDIVSFNHERNREIFEGRVQAISSRTGVPVDVRAEYLKPITRRRK